jgi:hypothetical protein
MKMQGDMCEVKEIKSQIFIFRKNEFSKNLENKIPVMTTIDHFSVALIALVI